MARIKLYKIPYNRSLTRLAQLATASPASPEGEATRVRRRSVRAKETAQRARRSGPAKANGAAKARHTIARPAWLRFVCGSRDPGALRQLRGRTFRGSALRCRPLSLGERGARQRG
jgi:hypothetical protein